MNNAIDIQEILYNSEDYIKELQLRDEILRKPLGLSIYNDDLKAEVHDFHLGAFLEEKLIGVLILTKLSENEMKMRQVAVSENLRGKNIGRKLVEFSELYSKEKGYTIIQLNARKQVVPFYEKLGYYIVGEEFMEVNIPHLKMKKTIKE